MEKNYQDYLASSRRLAVLRILKQSPSYTLNTQVLRDALETIGHAVGLDIVDADAEWLDQKRLVKKRHVEDFIVIRATQRGLDVSVGRSRQSGVRFPYLDAEQWSEQGEEDNS